MKLYVKDGRLRFDYEFQSDIKHLYENGGAYDFMGMIASRRHYPFPHKDRWWEYPHEDIYSQLKRHIEHCKKIGVNITPEAQAYIDDLKAKAEADKLKRERAEADLEALRETAKAKAKWALIRKHGCKGCSNLKRCEDDYYCAATKELLEEKEVARQSGVMPYYGGMCYPYLLAPYPSDTCPFKADGELTEQEKEAIRVWN